jgi:UDP-N-acetyl-D-galactosamine dehydrogenase
METKIMFKDRVIVIVGLGYVGLPLAVEFGKKRRVIGFDINTKRIEQLKSGFDRTFEVNKEELDDAKFISYTSNIDDIREGGVFIITVPTPVDKFNSPDLRHLSDASAVIGRCLKPGDIVVYESTVYPGATEEICVPILERESGLSCYISDAELNPGFYVAYSPERINPGDRGHRLENIKKITSASTIASAEAVDQLYQEIIRAGTHKASSIKVAEAAKVIENAQRDLNIAFVNELAVIFDRIEIDTTEVLAAASTKWNFIPFKPGLVGGHCIGVDPYYLTKKAEELGYHPEVILSGRRINNNMGRFGAQKLIRFMIRNGIHITKSRIGVFGITFKENCPDVRNSKVPGVVEELKSWGAEVVVCDPNANDEEVSEEYDICLTAIESLPPLDSIIIAVAHREFELITPVQLRNMCAAQTKPVIGDFKAMYERKSLISVGFDVFRF